jgi:hypothetical protein
VEKPVPESLKPYFDNRFVTASTLLAARRFSK